MSLVTVLVILWVATIIYVGAALQKFLDSLPSPPNSVDEPEPFFVFPQAREGDEDV